MPPLLLNQGKGTVFIWKILLNRQIRVRYPYTKEFYEPEKSANYYQIYFILPLPMIPSYIQH